MFTVEQIEQAHSRVKSGADFPEYIRALKQMGVVGFETWVADSHTEYFGENGYNTKSLPQYANMEIAENCSKDQFSHYLKIHQQGETDYHTFCKHCAQTGIEKWAVCLDEMTCTYYDKIGNKVLVEAIPQ